MEKSLSINTDKLLTLRERILDRFETTAELCDFLEWPTLEDFFEAFGEELTERIELLEELGFKHT